MIPGSLARRYARALIGLAGTPTQRDKFATDMKAFADLSKQVDDAGTPIIAVLCAERFSTGDRKRLIRSLGGRIGADPMVLKFLDHVVDKGRIEGLVDIARAYIRMADEAASRVQAHITSASELPPDTLAKIKRALERATGKNVVATTSVDPELIGGVVARIGSFVVDGSVRNSLQKLRASLRS